MGERESFFLIPDLKHKAGFLKYKSCTLIIRGGEIFVAYSNKELRAILKEYSPESHYGSMESSDILPEAQDNFSVTRNEIKRIRVEKGAGSDPDMAGGPDKLSIRTKTGKQLFIFGSNSPPAKDVRMMLERLFSGLVS